MPVVDVLPAVDEERTVEGFNAVGEGDEAELA